MNQTPCPDLELYELFQISDVTGWTFTQIDEQDALIVRDYLDYKRGISEGDRAKRAEKS